MHLDYSKSQSVLGSGLVAEKRKSGSGEHKRGSGVAGSGERGSVGLSNAPILRTLSCSHTTRKLVSAADVLISLHSRN